MDKKKHFQDFFSDRETVDIWEKVYDKKDIGALSVRRRMEQTLSWFDRLELPRDARILDAGSGAGFFSREIMRRGHEVAAMDYSMGMLRKTGDLCMRDGRPGVVLVQADVENIPLKDSTMDVVISLGVFSYLKRIDRTLHEFDRVLRPGGVLIFSTLNKINIVGYLDIPVAVRNAVKKVRKKKGKAKGEGLGGDSASKRLLFTPKVVKSLKNLGFEGLEYKTIPYRMLTFSGKKIPPERLNIRIVELLEKLPALPLIGPLGGLCVFKARKAAAKG